MSAVMGNWVGAFDVCHNVKSKKNTGLSSKVTRSLSLKLDEIRAPEEASITHHTGRQAWFQQCEISTAFSLSPKLEIRSASDSH